MAPENPRGWQFLEPEIAKGWQFMGPETASHWRFIDQSYFVIYLYDSSVLSQICSS